jgi:hypothetical protein
MRLRKRMLDDLELDIRDHLERETQDNIERGMSPEEARRAALRKFGNATRVKDQTWEVWNPVWVEQLIQDARFGLRTLWRSPGLTIAAVLAIALGIGVNVGVFSVLNGLALRLLPIPHAEQIVSVNQIFHGRFTRNTHNGASRFSYAEYLTIVITTMFSQALWPMTILSKHRLRAALRGGSWEPLPPATTSTF